MKDLSLIKAKITELDVSILNKKVPQHGNNKCNGTVAIPSISSNIFITILHVKIGHSMHF